MKVEEDVIYVLAISEIFFGEWSICGVYNNKVALIEGYQQIEESKAEISLHAEDCREPMIYRFPVNKFLGEKPGWNNGKLYFDFEKYEISIEEVRED